MRKVGLLFLNLALASVLCAQSPQSGNFVRVNPYPGTELPTQLFFYDGSGNTQYICIAQPTMTGTHVTTWAITVNPPTNVSGTVLQLTNVAVSTNTATATVPAGVGLQVGNRIVVVDPQTSAMAGTYYVQTVPSSTTFTFTTSGVSDGTYTDAGLAITTVAPRSSDNVWLIKKYIYDGSSRATNQQSSLPIGSFTNICDNRAVTTGATAIQYQ